MQQQIMEIVDEACNTEFPLYDCRGRSHYRFVHRLYEVMRDNNIHFPPGWLISEVAVAEQRQLIAYLYTDDSEYQLFCGIGLDGKFYAEVGEIDTD